jgi:protein ImuA
MPESSPSLVRLRRRVARIEGVRASGGPARFATGHAAIDAWLGGGLARGRLHEVLADDGEDSGSLSGFAAMLALRIDAGRPLLWLRTEAAERQAGKLYATGLGEIGLHGGDLILGLLADNAALLKAANDAARCAGLGALVVEAWGGPKQLDLTATRRLMLAAEASGVTVLLLRAAARESPSVADTRWRIAAAPSAALAADAPGSPAFDLELLRRRAGPAGRRWRVEWNRERRAFQPSDSQALSGAVLPVAAG